MVGSQKTERTVKEEHHSAKGSTVSAGRDVTITATGNANNANNNTDNSNNTNTNNSNTGNITLTGSEIKAGSDVNLTAANNLNVTAALNTQHSDRKETSKGGNVGIGLSFGGDESGFRFKGDANFSRERERQDGSAWSEGVITAGNTLNANIQNDANLTGAILNGNTVNLNVGGNLNLTSLQDSDDYDYDKISASINGSAGFGGASGNLAFDSTQMTSHWQSVTEQTGIFAGSGGYNITVNNNTNLTGAVIASEATDSSKNTLNTGTLTFSDIKNSANYKVDHVSLSVGTSNSSPTAGAPAIYHKEESSKNITHSAISDGTINIHDKENQTQDINELSHDTANAHHTLKPIFDKDKELEKIEIIDSIRDIANQAKDLAHKYDKLQAQKAVDKNGVPQKFKDEAAAALSQNGNKPTEAEINQLAYNNAVNDHIINQSQNNLGTMGGSVDKGITAAASIATGIITGNIAGGLAGASAPYLATVIKENTYEKDKNGNIVYENGQPKVDKQANLIAHAILGAAVAAAQNSSAIAGGLGAAGGEIAADTIRDLLYDGKPNDKLTESEKENISALTQLALGIATATATGGDMDATGAAVQAGKNSVENNLLSPTETSKLERLKSKLQSANTVEEREQIQSEIDYINQIDKETDAFIADVCQTGSKTSDACQAAHKIVADLKAQYDAEYSGYPASNPLLVKELFYNKEAAAKVDAAFANSAAGAWMYTLEQYMQTNNVSFDEAYQVHKTLIDINMAAEMASYLIMTKTAADLATKYGSKYNSTNKTPSPATAEDLLNKGDKIGHTLDDKLVNNILNTEKGARPDPSTYMSQAEIDAHLALFDDGAVRFTSKAKYEQYGTYGSKDSFVMPKSEFENIMIQSKGDLRIVEQKLGLEKGYLSNSDTIAVYIKKENFGKLNVPSGNEDGANKYWKPGGVTSGGIPEATLDFSKKPKVDIIDLETIKKQLSGNKK
ncbi:hemagglutinin repeat-containing protein [Orbaceae bacterium ESL0721]|nr:hemagglutinin repeat-containing protein [Orbaceae bacterium ESL0721]